MTANAPTPTPSLPLPQNAPPHRLNPPSPTTATDDRPGPPPESPADGADVNPEADLARAFVLDTDRHVFLTGRAGTGKTTFLRRLRAGGLARKRHVVVAPTGVAAINAGGATIHSTFALPFGTLSPQRLRPGKGSRGLSKRKARVLRAIDLLVIDEVSMVRADVLDAIDFVLRRVRRSARPFGGVQLLLIGDLHQLPPVVTRAEEAEMAARYPTPYFFGADCLRSADLLTIELKRVYRQADGGFVRLLGEVRAGRLTLEVLAALNARHVDPADTRFPGPDDGYVTLASHRSTAAEINRRHLARLAGEVMAYEAAVTGDFPRSAYPADEELELKVGAQVMFVKNDPDGDAFYNGKIGVVTALTPERVTVDCPGDDEAIEIGRLSWDNTKYSLEEQSKEVAEEVAGRFTQIPLRLAWAITIHKSQGLTFERVVIDAAQAFAHGQVYVALSRCRSLEGIVLRTPLGRHCAPSDEQVAGYTAAARREAPDADGLAAARRAYRRQLLAGAFDLGPLRGAASDLLDFYLRNERAYAERRGGAFEGAFKSADEAVFSIAEAFAGPLAELLAGHPFDEPDIPVPERAQRGATYLRERLRGGLEAFLATLDLVSDNREVAKRTAELAEELRRRLRIALAQLALVASGSFTAAAFERARTDASLGQPSASKRPRRDGPATVTASAKHPELLAALEAWRTERAARDEVPPYRVASTRTLRDLSDRLPQTGPELERVHGIGPVKRSTYGVELLDLVAEYCRERGVDPARERTAPQSPAPKPHVNASVALTLSMHGRGLSAEEIAAERELTVGTIRSHLARAVEAGRLEVDALIEPDMLARVIDYFTEEEHDLRKAFAYFEGRVDYAALRVVSKRARA